MRSLADEVPFDIPDSWEWVRLGTIASVLGGKRIPAGRKLTAENTSHIYIRVSDMKNGGIDTSNLLYVPDDIYPSISRYIICKEDVYITVAGTIGRVGKIPASLDGANLTENADRLVFREINQDWMILLLQSAIVQDQIAAATTQVGQPKLAIARIENMLIPVPPLIEQERIVSIITTIKPLLADYEIAETALTHLQCNIADRLKKSILQMAVQGKLVPQDPSDEPAELLLERIREEKARLVKDGKIKKDKHESVIFRRDNSHYEKLGTEERCIDEELPFEIPETWVWTRLENLCEYIQRGKSPKYSPIKKYPVVAQKCNQWSGFSIEKAQFIDPASLASYSEERILKDRDLMWNSTGLGTLGRMAIYNAAVNPYELAVADSHVTVIRPIKTYVLPEYLFCYFSNPSVQSIIEDLADGTTKQKELATSTIREYLVPVPPLSEQERIVRALDAVLPVVKSL